MTTKRQIIDRAFPTRTTSVFADLRDKVFSTRYAVDLLIENLRGGTPSDPNVTEAWLRKVITTQPENIIMEMVRTTISERGGDITDPEQLGQAITDVARQKNLNGFKRFPETGELYIEGRHVKAMLREAANIAVASGLLPGKQWGKTNKGLRAYFAEHLFVLEDKIGLGITAPTGVDQRFVSTYRGTGIQLEEFVLDAKVSFMLASDVEWPKTFWPTLMLVGEQNGLGASRSMGFGRFQTVGFLAL